MSGLSTTTASPPWRHRVFHLIDTFYKWVQETSPFVWGFVDTFSLLMSSVFRLAIGGFAPCEVEKCHRPVKPLELYEFQGCPYCQKVREVLSYLAIDHIVYPCPKESFQGGCLNSRYRPKVKQIGGNLMFPFIVDPNTDIKMYQSEDIIAYLWQKYGDKAPKTWKYRLLMENEYIKMPTLTLARWCRPQLAMGMFRAASRCPEKPLDLWGYESSPFVGRVQETLCSLELPYNFHVIPHGAESKRQVFRKLHANSISTVRQSLNMIKVPFLSDPNTGTEMFESSDIVKYLQDKYQTAPVPCESWLDYLPAGAKAKNT